MVHPSKVEINKPRSFAGFITAYKNATLHSTPSGLNKIRIYTVSTMALGILIMIFIIVVMVLFFIIMSGGIADMWDTFKEVWRYKQASALVGAGILLVILIVVGGGVSREGLTIIDILL